MSNSPSPKKPDDDHRPETFRDHAKELLDDVRTGNTEGLKQEGKDIIDHAKEKLTAAWQWYTSKDTLGKILWALPMLLILPLAFLAIKFAAPVLFVLLIVSKGVLILGKLYLTAIRIIGLGGYLFYKVVKGLYINVLVATRVWKGTRAWLKRRSVAATDPTMATSWKDLNITPEGGKTVRVRFSYFRILFKGVVPFVKGFGNGAAYLPILYAVSAAGAVFFLTSYSVFVWVVTLVGMLVWALRKRVPGLMPWVENQLPYIKAHQVALAKHIFEPHKVGPYQDERYITVPADAVLQNVTVDADGNTTVTITFDHVESETVQKFKVSLVKAWPFMAIAWPKKVKTPKTESWSFTVTENAESIPLWERALTLATVIPTAVTAAYLFLAALHVIDVHLPKAALVIATMLIGNLFIFFAGWEPGRKT